MPVGMIRAAAVALICLFLEFACASSAFAALPVINNFTPTSGVVGDVITINGSSFSSSPTVKFTGSGNASIVSASPTQILVKVRFDATSGPITVTNATGSTASHNSFTVATPDIQVMSPSSAPVGQSVIITGVNFSTVIAENHLQFSGATQWVPVTATVTAATSTALTTTVPVGAATGPLILTVGPHTGRSATFTVTSAPVPPSVTSISPNIGVVGDSITISGSGFGSSPSTNVVAFNGASAQVGSNSSATTIYTWVPPTATTGPITVTVNGLTGSSAPSNFTMACPTGTTKTTSTLAGLAGTSGSADGVGIAARFFMPAGLATDGAGNIYIADYGNDTIRKVASSGAVTTLAGLAGTQGTADGTGSSARFVLPRGVAVDGSGNVYVADTYNYTIRKISSVGVVTTIAGTPQTLGTADGTGSSARFNLPVGIAIDSSGNLYVSDYGNSSIRKVTPAGVVTTLAGLSGTPGSSDGTGSAARFFNPHGITVDGTGNVFVTDAGNYTIRKITPAGAVTTVAGLAGTGGFVDGTGSAARFYIPFGVAVESSGNLYVTDAGNNTIRQITPAGVVTTIAGLAGTSGSVDGVGSAARFYSPTGISLSVSGKLLVTDLQNYTVRVMSTTPACSAPSTPSISVPATSSTAAVTVSWTPNTSAGPITYFKLQRATSSSGPWTDLNLNIAANLTSYQDTVPASGTYYYQIAACNQTTCSSYVISTAVVVTLPPTPPNAPTSISLPASSSTGNFTVSWAPSSSGSAATFFKLQQAPTAGGSWTPVNLNIPVNQTTYAVSVGTGTYYYEAAACNTAGCSAYIVSSAIVVTPPPNAPAVSVPGTSSSASVLVSWTPSGGTATSFSIYRAPSAGGPWGSPITTVGAGATSYTDVVPGNGTYYYQVTASNGSGSASGISNAVVVTIVVTAPSLPPAATALNDLPAHDATVGTMAGQAGTDGGAATYTIPIMIPPGRAGMQPSLSLSYNSRSGNGPLGVGWSVSGLSSIHRCPKTPEQDGQTRGVSYSATDDRLCLDGQRLVVVNGLAYGATGAEYRTEVDSYARIIQVGGLTGTSTCFRVEQKDGRILHYGAVTVGSPTPSSCTVSAANARVNPFGPTGTPGTLSWLVERIEDRIGNNQQYAYSNYNYGEVLLQSVKYTGFTPTSAIGDRTVTLTYSARTSIASGATDVSSSFLANGETMQTMALASITTAVAGATVRTYTPHYVTSAYSGRLLMASLQECAWSAGASTCHSPTAFAYNDGPLDYSLSSLSALALPTPDLGASPDQAGSAYSVQTIGDLDGDGTREAAVGVLESDAIHTFVAQMTGDRVVQSAVDVSGTLLADPQFYVDIDGDGRSELMRSPLTAGDDQHVTFSAWKLARGTPASSVVQAGWTPAQNAAALFQAYTSNIPYAYNQASFGQHRFLFAADINGDGNVDIIVVQPTTSPGQCGADDSVGKQDGVFVYLNNTHGLLGSPQAPTASFTAPSGPLFCLTRTITGASYHELSIDHIADFDGNGLPDFYLVYGGGDTQAGAFAGVRLTQNSGGTLSVLTKTCTDIGLVSDSSPGSMTDECNWQQNNFATRWLDINGDGLEDFVIARPNQGTWQIRLNNGGGTLGSVITPTGSGASAGLKNYPSGGGGGYAFRYATKLPSMDVDGDGKPDLLVVSSANKFAQKMCTTIKVSTNTDGSCPGIGGFIAPAAPSGTEATAGLQCFAYACPEDPVSDTGTMPTNSGTPGYPIQWNGQPAKWMYSNGWGNDDNSVYNLAMIKFVQTGPAAIQANLIETQLASRLSLAGRVPASADDLFGDGLADLVTQVGCTNQQVSIVISGSLTIYQNACSAVDDGTYGPATFAGQPSSTFATNVQLYVNLNQGVAAVGGSSPLALLQKSPKAITRLATTTAAPLASAPTLPGLLYSSTNGLGDFAQWIYAPLSGAMTYSQDGIPGYSVPSTNGYVDGRHYYFASSMPVVSAMTQSTGLGDQYGFRGAAFDYAQAMYNRFGRGFQGFRTITTIVGEPGNNNRVTDTITNYNQKFPLTGKVSSVNVLARDLTGSTTHTVSVESDTWACGSDRSSCPQGDSLLVPTGGAPYRPVLDTQVVDTYDLSGGALAAEVDTYNVSPTNSSVSGWDSFGNLTGQTTTHLDKGVAGKVFLDTVSGRSVQTTNTYDTSDTAHWWINKLLSTSATSSIAYASGHALPAGTSAPNQIVATAYAWNTDRTPQTKSVQSGYQNQQSTTTYCYPGSTTTGCPTSSGPSYGLPTQVRINAPDLPSALSPTRYTSYSYTKDGSSAASDGYFVLTTTNALNQSTSTYHQTNDGQVTSATDPNGVRVATTYDRFGRPTRVDHFGNNGLAFESAIQSAYTACSFGSCSGVGEDNNEGNAAYRITTVQAGYPTKVTWYDLLGRPVKNAEAVYSGTSGGALTYNFSATLTQYDDMGTVSEQFAPYFIGTSPQYFTSFSYDSLNRPRVKIAPGAELDPTHGDVETDYTYSGRQTSIVVHARSITPVGSSCPTGSTTNLCLQMTRSTNALGQLMQTTESPVLTVGSAHLIATNYWTEPQGHVVAITDAEGNITSASYNQLGQRTQSVDPDQGTWNFTYDALGELLTQTDARSVRTTVVARDALGRTTQRQATPTGGVLTGMANEATYDTWTFDPGNGIGEVGSITRYRGSNLAAPSSNPAVWQESYGYESTTARPTSTTTTISEGSSPPGALTSTTAYDTTATNPTGHVVSKTYPSGLVVQNTYTAYGQVDALTNASTGYVYWAGLGQNQWSHTVKEQFPGVITGNYVDYNSTGQANILGWGGSTTDQMTYGYDSFGNLTQQTRAVPYSNAESYTYDAVQRLTKTSRTSGNIVSYGYSDSGNIASKTDFGTGSYSYGAINSRTSGCGPHAVYAVGGTSYSCDGNGNVIGGSTLTMTFDPNNQARTANRGGSGSITWTYNSLGERDYEVDTVERYFVGDGYRVEGAKKIHELGPVIVTRTGSTDSIAVSLRDRLGSTLDIVDQGVSTARQYDAFGKPRNGDMTDRAPPTLAMPDTIFGFTNHEHDDSVLLIHTKGRVFDYQLGRFLSVDPIIGNPQSTQSLNPYSYIGNNPLSGRDPTGYCAQVERSGDDVSCTFTPVGSHISQTATGTVQGDGSVKWNASASGNATVVGGNLYSGNTMVSLQFSSNGSNAHSSQKDFSERGKLVESDKILSATSTGNGTMSYSPTSDTTRTTTETDLGVMWPVVVNQLAPLREPEPGLIEPMDDLLKLHPLIGGADIAANCLSGNCNAKDVAVGVVAVVLPGIKVLAPAAKTVDQYALKAVGEGFYPVMKRGFAEPQGGVWLNAGDVWKYGTTKNPTTRYPISFLTGWGLRYEPQLSGTLQEALSAEKGNILNYLDQTGNLPPGNKIIR